MSDDTIAEITNFRSMPGVTEAQITTAAEGLTPYLQRSGGMIRRSLTCDAEGTWTDYVIWDTLAHARRAMEGFETAPEAAALMPLIDPASVAMRHDPVHLSV